MGTGQSKTSTRQAFGAQSKFFATSVRREPSDTRNFSIVAPRHSISARRGEHEANTYNLDEDWVLVTHCDASHVRATNTRDQNEASQFAYVSSSPPYSGSTAQSQSRNAGSSSYSSNIHIREDDPTISFSYTATNTSTGARPKQYRAPSYPSGSSQQSSSAYSRTSGLNAPSYTSGTSQPSSAVYPGTHRSNVTSSSKKPLYVAGSLSSLCERIERGIDSSNASSLVGKARVTMFTANKAYEDKDEEKAYLLYERYARMWAYIRESADYRNAPITFDRILGHTDIQTAYDRIDELKLSLQSRYLKLPVRPSLPTRTTQAQTPVSSARNTNSAGTGLSQRQTFQPLEPQQLTAGNITSSSFNTRSTGTTLSQSSNTRNTGATPSQTSSNTSRTSSTPVQPSSTAKSTGATPQQAGKSKEQNQATGTGQQSSVAKKDVHAGVMKGVRANLDCPICLDLLKNAKNLPCGHIICEECIGQWVASKGGVLSCPTCKTVHSLPSSGVAGLATNFVLNNLVAEIKKLEEVESEEEDEEPPPTTPTAPITPTTSTTPTIPSLVDMVTPQPHLSGIPVAETSFLAKNTRKNFKDAKGSTIRMRVQLCDFEGTNVRGRRCDKVEATVLSPTNEKENVSVSLMKRDGDYSLSFIPNKVGVHLVEAYLDNEPVQGSPMKVVVHPSAKFDQIIGPLDDPVDVVADGSMIYANNRGFAFLSTDLEGNWSNLYEHSSEAHLVSFGIDASNNRFYATVPNKSCVDVYDFYDGYKTSFGKRVLESPTGIAVSREGMVYVADSETNTIDVFRSNFSHVQSIQAGGNADHCSLALLALNPTEDRLIAADQGAECFKIFDVVNMKMVKMIKTRVQQAPAKPFGVTVDEDGNILMSVTFDPSKLGKKGGKNPQNNKGRIGAVITYNSDGYFLGKFGDNELKNPRGLCIVEDNVVVVEQGGDEDGPCLKVYKL
ncbi:Tripartite motif-containing protein 2 [Holothuria leucospilota]|uniref:Tripartite motif-containing protein 2 n=1 Tax=Holothuria leucospilota TaxID=206669 RepID=A0A9Q1HG11_HOLLE|nr:Tripartite motif-containing protein 2 [Holothuria leucospilota]